MQKKQNNNRMQENLNELIPIIESNGQQAVSARDLHAFLESRKDFSSWIKEKIKKYDLIENHDFYLLTKFGEQTKRGGHNRIEYILTMDAAKEFLMVEGNSKGQQAGKYFIEVKKRYCSGERKKTQSNLYDQDKAELQVDKTSHQSEPEELIHITENNGQQAVSARELYTFLELRTRFDKWIQRMFEYGFTENEDYQAIGQKRPTAQGNQTTFMDYALTLDCAKEISMLQRNSKGKQARRYFIEVEKRYRRGEREKTQRPPNLYDNAFVSVYVHELGALLRLDFIADKNFWIKNILSLILLHGGKRCLEEYGYIFSSQEKAEFVQKQLNQMCYKFKVPLKSLNMVCRFGLKHSGLLDTYNKVYNLNYLS